MGNEESTLIDPDEPCRTLSSRTLDGLAEYIKSGQAKKIVVLTGAGVSTSAGIPDFRSPETGLYANLARLNLPRAEAVFDISYFRENPVPFYTLANELYPGKFRPTITHSFIKLLHNKGLLLKLFTQNIDCLEREAGVPDEAIIEAHGSFAHQSCIDCKHPYPKDELREHVANMTIPRCHECEGLVKPDIVFFGEGLPAAFFESRPLMYEADLTIVMGTSLTVQPFASLPSLVQVDKPRVLINREVVGNLGSRADDVLLLEDCDAAVRAIAGACGWLEELEALWATTKLKGTSQSEDETHQPQTSGPGTDTDDIAAQSSKDKFELLQDEVDKLTKEVEKTLHLSNWHDEKVRRDLDSMSSKNVSIEQSNRSGKDTSDSSVASMLKAADESTNENSISEPKI